MNTAFVNGSRRFVRLGFFFLAVAFTAGVTIQIFLAGLATFDNPLNWARHVDFVNVIRPLPFLMLALALAGRLPNSTKGQSAALLALIFVQYVTAHSKGMLPWAAATHPIVAMVLLWVSVRAAVNGWRLASVAGPRSEPGQAKEPIFVHAVTAETER